jgi:hypothetical protein
MVARLSGEIASDLGGGRPERTPIYECSVRSDAGSSPTFFAERAVMAHCFLDRRR